MANPSNPFATRFVGPGRLPILGVTEAELSATAQRWQDAGRIGQIVGPHGAGKTTLTYALERFLEPQSGQDPSILRCRRLTFRPADRWATVDVLAVDTGPELPRNNALHQTWVVDGIESLSPLNRLALVNFCRHRRIGLILTTHRVIPKVRVLERLIPTVRRLRQISDALTDSVAASPVEELLLRQVFEETEGNLRECLMRLYDWWETARGGCLAGGSRAALRGPGN